MDVNITFLSLTGQKLLKIVVPDDTSAEFQIREAVRCAILRGTDLRGADLRGANLFGANAIVGGTRSDGYQFLLFKEENGKLMIRAGCHYFTIADARAHWIRTRNGTRLGNESFCLVRQLEEMAKILGWIDIP